MHSIFIAIKVITMHIFLLQNRKYNFIHFILCNVAQLCCSLIHLATSNMAITLFNWGNSIIIIVSSELATGGYFLHTKYLPFYTLSFLGVLLTLYWVFCIDFGEKKNLSESIQWTSKLCPPTYTRVIFFHNSTLKIHETTTRYGVHKYSWIFNKITWRKLVS